MVRACDSSLQAVAENEDPRAVQQRLFTVPGQGQGSCCVVQEFCGRQGGSYIFPGRTEAIAISHAYKKNQIPDFLSGNGIPCCG